MSDDQIGYRRPPQHTRFKPGVSGNPKGRPKWSKLSAAGVIITTLNAEGHYREGGRLKKAPGWQLRVRSWISLALKGNLEAAATLLLIREDALRRRMNHGQTIEVDDWLPEHHAHNGLLKTAAHAPSDGSKMLPDLDEPARAAAPHPSRG